MPSEKKTPSVQKSIPGLRSFSSYPSGGANNCSQSISHAESGRTHGRWHRCTMSERAGYIGNRV